MVRENRGTAVQDSHRGEGRAQRDTGTEIGMRVPFALFPRNFGLCLTACPKVRSWLAFSLGLPGSLLASVPAGVDPQFGTSHVVGQVMSSHHHRPFGRYQSVVRAQQAAQNSLRVRGIEVFSRFVE